MNDNQDMLYSIVLLLTPLHPATVRLTMGAQAHAAFLKTVRQADPALAEVLHTPHLPLRPFTVSPLQGVSPRGGQIRLSPGEEVWLRFTILYPPIFEQFMGRFLSPASEQAGRPVIRLGQAALLIKEILTTPGSHPWAGCTSWAQLVNQARAEDEITLQFTSPTAFGFGQKEWGKKVVVLPDPSPVFGSLIRSWNHIAPPALYINRRALMAYVDEHVVVKRLQGLETRMLRYRHAPQVGFIGRVCYGLMADDCAARAQLDALANLAFYTGVGMKTTQGMGQVKRF